MLSRFLLFVPAGTRGRCSLQNSLYGLVNALLARGGAVPGGAALLGAGAVRPPALGPPSRSFQRTTERGLPSKSSVRTCSGAGCVGAGAGCVGAGKLTRNIGLEKTPGGTVAATTGWPPGPASLACWPGSTPAGTTTWPAPGCA
eukprot:scaffold91563_cov60-Phaeocystis_antarctica.AAC.3